MQNRRLRVLLIEDNMVCARLVEGMLARPEAGSFEVQRTDTLLSTLDLVTKSEFDVALLDLTLPDSQGLETFLTVHRFAPVLPIIVVTGREDIESVDRAFQAGATSFVVKPLNWRLLSHQIRYVHRAAGIERQLTEGRDEAALQLQRLAAESTRFLAHALAQTPALKPAAVSFAKAADAVLQPRPSAEAA